MAQDNPLLTLSAEQIMTPDVMTVPCDWSVERLARFLTDKSISGAPVVDQSGRLTGVITLADIVRHAGSGVADVHHRDDHFYQAMKETHLSDEDLRAFHESVDQTVLVDDVMTPVVFQVAPKTSLHEVAEAMVKGRIHRVLVTEHGQLKGIISALDLLKVMTD